MVVHYCDPISGSYWIVPGTDVEAPRYTRCPVDANMTIVVFYN